MKTTLILLLWLPLAVGCRKERAEPLPAATQTGANTLGCKVNGKAWVAQDSDELFNRIYGVEGGYQSPIGGIRNNVWIRSRRNDGTSIDIYLERVGKPGVYLLDTDTDIRPGMLDPYSYGYYFGQAGRYVTESRYTGTVTVTRADTVNKIVSGTFEFTAYDPQKRQTVIVTEGRFDVKTR